MLFPKFSDFPKSFEVPVGKMATFGNFIFFNKEKEEKNLKGLKEEHKFEKNKRNAQKISRR